ncbi:putative mannitol dehydrogenase [Chytridium lagenaria]|nr:putative mannitol dehydrogenase [Chytridium lagenaria]
MTTSVIKAFSCSGKGELLKPFTYTPRPLGGKDVEIEISHCGICGSDIHTLDSGWGPTTYPCVVDYWYRHRVGPDATKLKIGDRVGVGAQVWACLDCPACNAGLDNFCSKGVFTYNAKYQDGQSAQGGYASHVRVQEEWAINIPASLSSEVAAPLMCAGVTVFAPLKKYITRPGMKFAAKMGSNVVAISHSPNKKEECTKLGATDFAILENEDDYARIASTLDILLISSFHDSSLDKLFGLLGAFGQAILVAIPEVPVSMHAFSVILGAKSLSGSLIGTIKQLQETIDFAAEHDVKPWIEVMPMEQVNEAISKVRSGKPRFRIVLENTPSTFTGPDLLKKHLSSFFILAVADVKY